MIAGIDESGRGPVLASMVMAIAATEDEEGLRKRGVRDSKDLTPEKREQLFEQLDIPHEIISVSPAEIDAAVDGQHDNLNLLEARTSALLIHKLVQHTPVEKVILDSPTKSTEKYEAVVREALVKLDPKHEHLTLQCEIKADANYPVVGAASIFAKVTRDREIAALKEEFGDIGSGYPADPKTQAFLKSQWKEGHDFFRKSWQSYKRMSQPTLEDFGEKAPEHKKEVEKFEFLKEHGFSFCEPTNQYEVIRMKKDRTTVIKYTTGKVVVQGPEKEAVEKLL
ncbi:MAG: ribonuclease HII [Candidatus Woesearchaeota archaeon]|nr:ribonuclease HII [Candidatus Woesearchaeota archaeon]